MLKLVEYTREFFDYSWSWLNDPEIKYLTDTPAFTKMDQKIWFDSIKTKNNYLVYGIEYYKVPIGCCGLKNIQNTEGEYFVFIGNKDYWGKGLGKLILKEIEKIAIINNLNSIWLKVVKANIRAIKSYTTCGFIIENDNSSYLIMRKGL